MLKDKGQYHPWIICALFVMLWLGISASAVAQNKARADSDTEHQPTLESLLTPLGFDYYGRIAVLPPKNPGDKEHDWISIAIQDALTQDLWQVEAFEALSLQMFSSEFTSLCPNLQLRCLTQAETEVNLPSTSGQSIKQLLPSHN